MKGAPGLLQTLLAKLWRDRYQSARVLVLKGARYAVDLATAQALLAGATSVGRHARTRGQPSVENLGRLVIGDRFQLTSRWVQSHLVTGPAGTLTIGDDVHINFGAAISARLEVRIGHRVQVGPWAIIMDSDYHSVDDRGLERLAPVVIEDDVWLAARVTVLKGARIGRGTVVGANSVVVGELPPGVLAAGVPARVLRPLAGPLDRGGAPERASA